MFLSLETIQYQHKDRFEKDLKALLGSIYDSVKSKEYKTANEIISKHPAVKKIEALVMDRLGLNIEITKDLYVISPAAVIPFFGDYMRGYGTMGFYQTFGSGVKFGDILKKIEAIDKAKLVAMKKAHNKTGFVDLKHARVGGYLSDLRHYVLFDFVWMYKHDITPDEQAGIMTHELGHAFDGLEEHYRLQTTNRAIFDILVDLREGNEDKALYRYRNTFTEKEFRHAQLDTSAERQDFCSELALRYLDTIKGQYLDDKYDETNFENMADTFAARFGMGKDVVSGLQKLYLAGGAVLPRNGFGYSIVTLVQVLTAAMILLIVPPFGALAYVGVSVLFMGKRNADLTYDLPIDRYQRIKNTMINAIKNTKLPTDVIKDLLDQIGYIDTLIEGFMSNDFDLGDAIANLLSPSSRRAVYYINLQQDLERNLNNELFVKAAQLRTL